jgi:hypothetical protein
VEHLSTTGAGCGWAGVDPTPIGGECSTRFAGHAAIGERVHHQHPVRAVDEPGRTPVVQRGRMDCRGSRPAQESAPLDSVHRGPSCQELLGVGARPRNRCSRVLCGLEFEDGDLVGDKVFGWSTVCETPRGVDEVGESGAYRLLVGAEPFGEARAVGVDAQGRGSGVGVQGERGVALVGDLRIAGVGRGGDEPASAGSTCDTE